MADSPRKRSRAAFSSRAKRFWRRASSSKLTRWPSKSAPSTQANFICPPTVTRHDPHIPVPSTMIEFRLTMVGIPKGRVTSQQAFIMGIGPIATTSRTPGLRASTSASAWVTKPVPSVAAVIRGDDQFIGTFAEAIFPENQVLIAKSDNRDGAVALVLVLAQLRKDRGDAQAAAHQHHRAIQLADVAGQAERADEIQNGVALGQLQHLKGSLSNSLDDYRDECRGERRNRLRSAECVPHARRCEP